MLHPNDWWVVADDDEFHKYSKDFPLQIPTTGKEKERK